MLIIYVSSVVMLAGASVAAARKRPKILAGYVPAFALLSIAFIVLIVVVEG